MSTVGKQTRCKLLSVYTLVASRVNLTFRIKPKFGKHRDSTGVFLLLRS